MRYKEHFKYAFYISFTIFFICGSFYFVQKYRSESKAEDMKIEKEKALKTEEDEMKLLEEQNRIRLCNGNSALECFYKQMKTFYPDWPIYSPSVSERLDCIYNITFTTVNPHFTWSQDYEVHVVEISFDLQKDVFNFKSVRNRLW
jgi:hypothetical protein